MSLNFGILSRKGCIDMKRLCRVVCLAVMIALSIDCTSAFAADWYYVGTSDSGDMSVFIDNASVIKNNHSAVVWTKWTNPDGSYVIDQWSLTHTPKTFTVLSTTEYDSKGNVVDFSDNLHSDSHTIVPESMSEAIWYCIWAY